MRSGENRVLPLVDSGMSPVLFWDESHPSADGAALACPQCGGANLHLDEIHFAAPTEDHYAPTVGVSIDAATATIRDGDDARQLHAGANRGPMLAASYWCENGCRGRIELREHCRRDPAPGRRHGSPAAVPRRCHRARPGPVLRVRPTGWRR